MLTVHGTFYSRPTCILAY